ncbi:MAG TPA: CPBP family intramembrane glutamic endopeptidase [Methylococcaceae bacterium]|nr:CPBP family intramembrane glutamic endopeptidase [Methylococcaceae bacterium]
MLTSRAWFAPAREGALLAPLLLLLAALGLAGLLAPPLFAVLDGRLSLETLLGRGALLLIALTAWLCIRREGFNRSTLGIETGGHSAWRALGAGFLLGVLILAVLSAGLVWLGIRLPDWESLGRPWPLLLQSAGKALLTGTLVALIEEPLFRGVLLGVLRQKCGIVLAVIFSAFYYALPHFLHAESKIPLEQMHWDSGLRLAADALRHMADWRHADSFLALWLAGVFLAVLRLRSNLFYCIGVHAGWVFVLRLSRSLTDLDPHSPRAAWVGSYDSTIGWLAAAWLGLVTVTWLAWLHHRRILCSSPV